MSTPEGLKPSEVHGQTEGKTICSHLHGTVFLSRGQGLSTSQRLRIKRALVDLTNYLKSSAELSVDRAER
ncbi:MAG: hypothetical protein Q8912_15060 [Bacillota bacterium]|nr:hypothetical protein [Bacillota bacterium]MDP4161014.1 hypothetical protein [Bacillota bacterium]